MPLPNAQPGITAAPTDTTNTPAVAKSGAFNSMTSGIASMVSGIKNFFGGNDDAKKKNGNGPTSP